MSNTQINPNEEGRKRESFRIGVGVHALVFVIANAAIWLIWAVIPHDPSAFTIPFVITGSWLILLIVHAVIVFAAHSPRQVRHDEVKREYHNR